MEKIVQVVQVGARVVVYPSGKKLAVPRQFSGTNHGLVQRIVGEMAEVWWAKGPFENHPITVTIPVAELIVTHPPKHWTGAPPPRCNICEAKLAERFVDGRCNLGSWCIMCPPCHTKYGLGLGTGLGQEFVIDRMFPGLIATKTIAIKIAG